MTAHPLPWRSVWITGASSGLGLEFARLLDHRVEHVAGSSPEADKLAAIEKDTHTFRAFPLDVTDEAAVRTCAARIDEQCGPIDLAVLNAGIWKTVKLATFDPSEFRASMDVNFLGVVNCLSALVPRMIARRNGHIAIVASVGGFRGLPKAAAYGPTKAALINLVESLRPQLEAKGIKISLINPGFVDTPMTKGSSFPKPFLMPAPKAAQRMLDGLVAGKYEIVFPRRAAYVSKVLRVMPNPLFFWFARKFFLGKE